MDGYMIDVSRDEQTLSVRGKNKAAKIALAGEAHGDGDVVIPRFTIAGVRFKGANMLVNAMNDLPDGQRPGRLIRTL